MHLLEKVAHEIQPGWSIADGPVLEVPWLGEFSTGGVDTLAAALASFPGCPLGQAWRTLPEADFLPGSVRAGWCGQTVWVYADLVDADAFTRAADRAGDGFERFWELGDVFEMMFRPAGQAAYWELHVTPNNRRAQLRFRDSKHLRELQRTGRFETAALPDEVFHSTVWVRPEQRRWRLLAEIPAGKILDRPGSLAGTEWQFSFSRYEYARGRTEPVLSSTSAHRVLDFHRQTDWGRLRFGPGPQADGETD